MNPFSVDNVSGHVEELDDMKTWKYSYKTIIYENFVSFSAISRVLGRLVIKVLLK
jgi:hypothetical protein